MNKKAQKLLITILAISGTLTIASEGKSAGLLKTTNGMDNDNISLKSHKVQVTINNGYAKTEVDQVFYNSSSRDLETVYTFPMPEKSSLSEVSLWINGKEVIGEVFEKQRARQLYDAEVNKKIDPALAEKDEHKAFKISVYPLTGKADTKLRFVYYQPITIDQNIGRYVYPLSDATEDTESDTFWSINNTVENDFSFNLDLKSAFPLQGVLVPEYKDLAKIENNSPGKDMPTEKYMGDIYNVSIEPEEGHNLDKDIIVYYRLNDKTPARVELVPYRNGKTGTFMTIITPGDDLKPIANGNDWTIIADVSGSMRGKKSAKQNEGISRLLKMLGENDRFRIIAFNNNARDITDGYAKATEENKSKYIKSLAKIVPGGSTRVFPAMTKAYSGMDKSRTTAVILTTDGNIQTDAAAYEAYLRELENHDLRLFTFLIGNGGNKPVMEQMAKDSEGFAMAISESDDLTGRIAQAKASIMYENMRDVELTFNGVKVKDITPGYISSLYRGQQLVVFGRYNKPGKIEMNMSATIGTEKRNWKCSAILPEQDSDNPELERLWALSAIEGYMQEIRDEGETNALRAEVIKLGKEYSLVTDYTSMLVLTEEKFKELNTDRKNLRRVQQERQSQQQRKNQPIKNYRVDNNNSSNDSQQDKRDNWSPGIGGGPVGPVLLLMTYITKRKKNKLSNANK